MTSQHQYQWAAGSGGVDKPSPRVDKLAKLYQRMDALKNNPKTNREDWLRLASDFAELKAMAHVDLCYKYANERKQNGTLSSNDR